MLFKEDEEPIIGSKNSFYFGFVSGIALVSLFGILFLGSQYIKKEFGTSRLQNVEQENTVPEETDDEPSQPTEQDNEQDNKQGNEQGNDEKPVKVSVSATDHIRGKKNAPITIVEYSDYQCPYCKSFHTTMKEVMKNYPDDVRWVLKHYPLNFHPFAQKAAEGAECAGEQNKFWEYSDKIYENQDNLSSEMLSQTAKDLGLNAQKFDNCLSSGKMAAKVKADLSEGQALGVRGTPGSFINGKSIPGAVPYSTIDGMIKAELNK